MKPIMNQLLQRLAHLGLALVAGLLLSACGGGGGGGGSAASGNNTTSSAPANTRETTAAQAAVVIGTTLENFSDATSIAYWKFSNGKEFPGASGSISTGEGHDSSAGLKLNYTFRCILDGGVTKCGRYVSADYTPPKPIEPGAAIRVMVRTPAEIEMGLRVVDESGQTLQYRLSRPLEARHADTWYPVVASLQHPYVYWGGANNGVVHRTIKSISVLANVHASVHPISGSVAIDDVAMLDSFDSTHFLDLKTIALTPVPPTAAELGRRVGIAYHPSRHTPITLDHAKSAGIAFGRTDMYWVNVEKNDALGSYDFARYDELLAELEKRGMGALFIISPSFAPAAYDIYTPAGVAAYARFAKAAAQRYAGRDVRFEIVNEPNHSTFWKGTPEQYFALCKAAIDAVHKGNRSAQVSTGGLATGKLSLFDVDFLNKLLASGAGDHANAIGNHPYRPNGPETVVSTTLLGEYLVRKITGKAIPIWNTEWGYSLVQLGVKDGHADSFRHRQAVMLARTMLSQWVVDAPMVVWYDLGDDGLDKTNNEHNFGLLDVNHNEKPAIVALRQFSTWAQGRVYKGLMKNLPAGLHVMKLEGPDDTVFIAWNSEPNATINLRIPAAGSPSVVDFLGSPLSGMAGGGGASSYREFALGENDGPIYMRYAKGA